MLADCGHFLCSACFVRIAKSACPVCRVSLTSDCAVRVGSSHQSTRAGGVSVVEQLSRKQSSTSARPSERASVSPKDTAARVPPPRWHALADHRKLRGDVVPQLPWRSSSKLDLLIADLQAIAAHNAACGGLNFGVGSVGHGVPDSSRDVRRPLVVDEATSPELVDSCSVAQASRGNGAESDATAPGRVAPDESTAEHSAEVAGSKSLPC